VGQNKTSLMLHVLGVWAWDASGGWPPLSLVGRLWGLDWQGRAAMSQGRAVAGENF